MRMLWKQRSDSADLPLSDLDPPLKKKIRRRGREKAPAAPRRGGFKNAGQEMRGPQLLSLTAPPRARSAGPRWLCRLPSRLPVPSQMSKVRQLRFLHISPSASSSSPDGTPGDGGARRLERGRGSKSCETWRGENVGTI